MPLAPGTKLGPYEIFSPLGSGGMGEVYRARDTASIAPSPLRFSRTISPSILTPNSASNAKPKPSPRSTTPTSCSLFDVGSQDGTDFLAMECIEGESLAQRVAKGALPTDQVLRIGAEIADALDKAHRSGVVHRDLKPGNIMLTKAGAKLLDFGLAKPTLAPVSRRRQFSGHRTRHHRRHFPIHVARAGRRQGPRRPQQRDVPAIGVTKFIGLMGEETPHRTFTPITMNVPRP